MAFDRAAAKTQLLNRTRESASKADDSGRFSNIFKKDVKLPLWSVKEGTHTIDILPYVVGENHPTRTYPDVHEGDFSYVLDIWVHRGIGVNEDSYVCPARNYNLPCPICEEVSELRKTIDPDAKPDDPIDGETVKLIRAISPKRRTVYNIVCWDNQVEADKGVQLLEIAHFFMEKHLTTLSERPRGGGHISFSDPDDGQSIIFKREGSGINTSFIGHRFDLRPEPIGDDLLDMVYCLDDIITIPTYEELYEVYFGHAYDNQVHPRTTSIEEQVAPRAARTTRTTGAPASEAETTPDVRPRQRPAAATTPQATVPAEEPATRPRQRPAAATTPTQRTTIPTPQRAAAASTQRQRPAAAAPPPPEPTDDETCPMGGRFGYDIDTLEGCNDCQLWDSCARMNATIGQNYNPDEGESEPPQQSVSPRRQEASPAPRRAVQSPPGTSRRR